MTPDATPSSSQAAQAPAQRLLGDVLPLADTLVEQLRMMAPGVSRISVTGDLRRRTELVGDTVQLLASARQAGPLLEALVRSPGVTGVLSRGASECTVRLGDGLKVSLQVVPEEEFALLLHHLTGSKGHLARLRGLARGRGFRLSERSLRREDGTPVSVSSEPALYRMLGLQYIPPELREDTGELDAALTGRLPEDLISLGDVQGAVHSHSTWSDGRNTLEEMARAAQALGLRYLTVTEHSEAAIYARGLKQEDLRRQWEEIDRINATLTDFRLLKGIEVDILEDGALDYPDSLLEQLEVVIGSIHVRHGMDEEQMTRRVLHAMDNPHLHILGHLTGRLLQSREPYPLKMEAVLERAAERGVAVEVNGKPQRLDIKTEYVRMAMEHGAKLVVSCDAHDVTDLFNLSYAVATARRGWARRDTILNTRSAQGFVDALKQQRAS
jgi:DNA polymerase (family 10)